eukprot:Skav225306  [mRNA]  locus=scaffold23:17982:28440:- [translate_table: standard]
MKTSCRVNRKEEALQEQADVRSAEVEEAPAIQQKAAEAKAEVLVSRFFSFNESLAEEHRSKAWNKWLPPPEPEARLPDPVVTAPPPAPHVLAQRNIVLATAPEAPAYQWGEQAPPNAPNEAGRFMTNEAGRFILSLLKTHNQGPPEAMRWHEAQGHGQQGHQGHQGPPGGPPGGHASHAAGHAGLGSTYGYGQHGPGQSRAANQSNPSNQPQPKLTVRDVYEMALRQREWEMRHDHDKARKAARALWQATFEAGAQEQRLRNARLILRTEDQWNPDPYGADPYNRSELSGHGARPSEGEEDAGCSQS